MNTKKWVQHKSGQGEKWELSDSTYNDMNERTDWQVYAKQRGNAHYLPKSEYVPCDPPEEWRDVTDDVVFTGEHFEYIDRKTGKRDHFIWSEGEFRAKKYRNVFIIERKIS